MRPIFLDAPRQGLSNEPQIVPNGLADIEMHGLPALTTVGHGGRKGPRNLVLPVDRTAVVGHEKEIEPRANPPTVGRRVQ